MLASPASTSAKWTRRCAMEDVGGAGAVQNTQYLWLAPRLGGAGEFRRRSATPRARGREPQSRRRPPSAALAGQTEHAVRGRSRDAYRSAVRKLQDAVDGFNRAGNDVAATAASRTRQPRRATSSTPRRKRRARRGRPARRLRPKPQPRESRHSVPASDDTPPPRTQPSRPRRRGRPESSHQSRNRRRRPPLARDRPRAGE